MSEKFEIGGQCVCVPQYPENGWNTYLGRGAVGPSAGDVLTILGIHRGRGSTLPDWDLFLSLSGYPGMIYDSRDFRPCKKTSIECFEQLLKNIPKELEDECLEVSQSG